MWILEVRLVTGEVQRIFLLPGREYTIGRKECDILLPNEDPSISRHHATIVLESMTMSAVVDVDCDLMVTLKDYAKHGTFVNKERIGKDSNRVLDTTDTIRFGLRVHAGIIVAPLVIGLSVALTEKKRKDVMDVASSLGALIVHDPVPTRESFAERGKDCLGFLYVTHELYLMTKDTMLAIASRYTLVTTDYLQNLLEIVRSDRTLKASDWNEPATPLPAPPLDRWVSSQLHPSTNPVFFDVGVFLQANPHGSTLFSGFNFLFFDDDARARYETILKLTDGMATEVTKESMSHWCDYATNVRNDANSEDAGEGHGDAHNNSLRSLSKILVVAATDDFATLCSIVESMKPGRSTSPIVAQEEDSNAANVDAYKTLFLKGLKVVSEMQLQAALLLNSTDELGVNADGALLPEDLQDALMKDEEEKDKKDSEHIKASAKHTDPEAAAAAHDTSNGKHADPAEAIVSGDAPRESAAEQTAPKDRRLSSREPRGSAAATTTTASAAASAAGGRRRYSSTEEDSATVLAEISALEAADPSSNGHADKAGDAAAEDGGATSKDKPSLLPISTATATKTAVRPRSGSYRRNSAGGAAPATNARRMSAGQGAAVISPRPIPPTPGSTPSTSALQSASRDDDANFNVEGPTEMNDVHALGRPGPAAVTAAQRNRAAASKANGDGGATAAASTTSGTTSGAAERSAPTLQKKPIVVHLASQVPPKTSPTRRRIAAHKITPHQLTRNTGSSADPHGYRGGLHNNPDDSLERSANLSESDLARGDGSASDNDSRYHRENTASENGGGSTTGETAVAIAHRRRKQRERQESASSPTPAARTGVPRPQSRRSSAASMRRIDSSAQRQMTASKEASNNAQLRMTNASPTPRAQQQAATHAHRTTAGTPSVRTLNSPIVGREGSQSSAPRTNTARGCSPYNSQNSNGGAEDTTAAATPAARVPFRERPMPPRRTPSAVGGGADHSTTTASSTPGSAATSSREERRRHISNTEGAHSVSQPHADQVLGRRARDFLMDTLKPFAEGAERACTQVTGQNFLDSQSKRFLEDGVIKTIEFLQYIQRAEQEIPAMFSTENTRKACYEIRQNATSLFRRVKNTYTTVKAQIPIALVNARTYTVTRPISPRRNSSLRAQTPIGKK